jgi:hypothetical protein
VNGIAFCSSPQKLRGKTGTIPPTAGPYGPQNKKRLERFFVLCFNNKVISDNKPTPQPIIKIKPTPMEKDNKKSPHILGASSNLVGFSFIILTTIQVLHIGQLTLIDEIAAIGILLFSASCFFSFLSIRTKKETKSLFYENIADLIFFTGLLLLLIAAFFIVFSIIK